MAIWRIALCSVKWIIKIVEYEKEVTGNWYIDLTDAVANKLLELKAYGGCVQASTPTPSTPVDIVCNNWTLKVRKESWLPFRYKKVEYITASSTQWLNTWIKLASTDIVEAEYKNSSTTWYWALYWVFAMWDSSAFYANWTYYWYDVANAKVDTWISVDTSRHTLRHDFGGWVITLDNTTTTFTPFTFDNSKNNYLFSRYYNNSYWYWFKGSCRKYKIYRWWELICDLIPVIDTQNNDEPWMYDLVSGDFRWNVWTWNFTAWADAQDDVEVYVEWTTETINAHGKNLFDKNSSLTNGYINSSGTVVSSGWLRVSQFIEIKPNTTYTISWTGDVKALSYDRYAYTYTAEQTPIAQVISQTGGASTTFTTAPNAKYIRIQITSDAVSTCQLEFGSTVTEYAPYYDGGTATCEDLLWVWDIKDEQEILSGNVITKVGVMVLDWTENWTSSGWVYYAKVSDSIAGYWRKAPICTHYVGSDETNANMPSNSVKTANNSEWTELRVYVKDTAQTSVANFTQYLEDQLNAWTPVIVVYPLATTTTLSVAWQHLSIPAWDSTIEIVEWSILNLPLYAKYKSTSE